MEPSTIGVETVNRYQRRMEFGPQPSISSLVSMSTSFRKIYGKKLEELQRKVPATLTRATNTRTTALL